MAETIIKTVRIDKEISDKIELLKNLKNTTIQDVIGIALQEYLNRQVDQGFEQLEIITQSYRENLKNEKHMFVPIEYYASFNDVNILEVTESIKKGNLKSISIGNSELVVIDINESMFKKAELLTIKNNINQLTKKVSKLERELLNLKRKTNHKN